MGVVAILNRHDDRLRKGSEFRCRDLSKPILVVIVCSLCWFLGALLFHKRLVAPLCFLVVFVVVYLWLNCSCGSTDVLIPPNWRRVCRRKKKIRRKNSDTELAHAPSRLSKPKSHKPSRGSSRSQGEQDKEYERLDVQRMDPYAMEEYVSYKIPPRENERSRERRRDAASLAQREKVHLLIDGPNSNSVQRAYSPTVDGADKRDGSTAQNMFFDTQGVRRRSLDFALAGIADSYDRTDWNEYDTRSMTPPAYPPQRSRSTPLEARQRETRTRARSNSLEKQYIHSPPCNESLCFQCHAEISDEIFMALDRQFCCLECRDSYMEQCRQESASPGSLSEY